MTAQTVALPKRWPMIIEPGNRDESTNQDAKLVNCYVETNQIGQEKEFWVYKRPGLIVDPDAGGTGAGEGAFNWLGDIYAVFGTTLYKNAVSIGTVDGTGGVYRFDQVLGATPKMVLGNGVSAYYYDGTTLTQINAYGSVLAAHFVIGAKYTITTTGTTDFTLIGAAASTPGTVFTATGIGSGTGTAALTATSFVIGVTYKILVVGTTDFTLIGASANTVGTVFTATGVGVGTGTVQSTNFPTPLVKGWAYLDGTLYAMTPKAHILGSNINDPAYWDPLNDILAQIEPDLGVALGKQLVYVVAMKQWSTEIFYDAGNPVGSPLAPVQGAKINYGCASANSVQNIDDSLIWLCTTRSASIQVILMEGLKATIVSTKQIERLLDHVDLSTVYSFQFKDEGHSFYIVTIKNANLTLVYDMREKVWHQWTDENGNYFPFVSSSYNTNRQHLFQHESNGNMYYADRDYLDDAGKTITIDIYTPNFDAETKRRKTLNMIYFSADQIADSTLSVRYNDNDYDPIKWSHYRLVDLGNQKPQLQNNGTFVRRAYHFRHAQPTRFRIKAVDLQLDLGTL